jgi:hypothetical protein
VRHFLFERLEYRINPQFKNPRKRSVSMGLHTLSHLRRGRGGGASSRRGSGGGGYAPDARQKCVVKTHYSKSMEAHLEQINKYLVREGTGKDGKGAELYGTPENEYRAHMVNKNFRIFLSPASNNIPLETLANTFIKKLELQTGYKLYWVASDHYNTAHHHTHLLINGVDKNGRDVFFPRDMVKTLMRESARDICTSLAGPRTRAEMEVEKKAVLTANRYTYIDENLKSFMVENRIDCAKIKKDRERYAERLDHLRKLGLCGWKGGEYVLSGKWEETLKTAGRYNTFLDARKAVRYTPEAKVELYESEKGIKQGIVTKIYKTDEVSDNHAVLLESIDGKAYFIPLYRKPEVRAGETVTVIPKKNERGRLTAILTPVHEAALLRTVKEKGYKEGYAGQVSGAAGQYNER